MTVPGDPARPGARSPVAGTRLGRWLRRPAALSTVAGAVVVVALALRGAVVAPGWFHLDDLVFVARAHFLPPDFLTRDHAGHLMPGAFVLVWVLTTLAPLSWGAVVALALALTLLVDLAALRLLVILVGWRPAILLPFLLFATTAITLPATAWWAAALNQLPGQLATLLALTAHVRHLRSGRTADAVRSALAVSVGLLFSERVILVIPLLAVVTLLWFVPGSPAKRLRAAWRRARSAWLLLGGVAVAYTGVYLSAVTSPLRGLPDPVATTRAVIEAAAVSVVPGLLGGPWVWRHVPRTLPTAAPPTVLVLLAALVGAAVVVASIVLARGATRAWALLAGWLVLEVGLVAASRGQVFDPAVLVREYRYLTELAVVGTLGVVLAFLPVTPGGGAPPVLRPRGSAIAVRLRACSRPSAGAAAAAVLLAGAIISGVGYAAGWADNPARAWVASARTGLAAAPGVVLVDAPVPDEVMWVALAPANTAAVLLAAVPERPHFLAEGEGAVRPAMVDERGWLVPVRVTPESTGRPGPAPGCGWAVTDRAVTVPLETPLGAARRIVRVGYLSSRDQLAWIGAAGVRAPVLLPAGLHDVAVPVSGPLGAVTVELRDPTAPVCVGLVEVGPAGRAVTR